MMTDDNAQPGSLEWLDLSDLLSRPIPSRESEPRWQLAMALAVRARDMNTPWAPQATNRVKCRGERLSKIIWKGHQWAATAYGVECRDGCYVIARDRLWEKDDVWPWVFQMAGKTWPDLEDFAEALRIARIVHCKVEGSRK